MKHSSATMYRCYESKNFAGVYLVQDDGEWYLQDARGNEEHIGHKPTLQDEELFTAELRI